MENKAIVYGIIGLLLGVCITLVITTFRTNYPMMGFRTGMMGSTSVAPSSQAVAQIKQEEDEGQTLFEEIQSKTKSCTDLSPDDFEKIGDYVMKQRVGSSETHAAMDANMEQMMGKEQNAQMHISLGKDAAGCVVASDTSSIRGTVQMMNNSSKK